MKCSKCENEIKKDSKFCDNCGEKVVVEENLTSCVNDAVESTRRLWFIIGFLKGSCSSEKEKKMYNNIMKSNVEGTSPQIYADYEMIVKYWKDFANLDVDDYSKKTLRDAKNRSK